MARSSLKPYLWMLCGSFSFSWMVVLVHEVDKEVDWQVTALARSLIPLGIMLGWCVASGIPLAFLRPPILWMRSIAGSISLIGTFYVLQEVPASDVATISNIFPIWVALLSWPFLGESPSGMVWCSVLCGVLGVALVQQPHLAKGNFSVLIVLAVSLFTALAMLGLHRLKGLDPRAIVVHFSFVSTLFALTACLVFDRPKGWAGLENGYHWAELAGIGLTATIGQIFLTMAFTHGEPAKISVVGLTQVLFTLAIEALIFNTWPAWEKYLGVPLVIGPTAWLMWRQRQDHTLELEQDLEEMPTA